MKNTLLVSFLFFFTFQIQAQVEFAPVGATWHFDYYSFVSVLGYEKIVSAADTVVLGKPSKKLELELVWKDVGIIPTSGVSHEIHFIHQDGDKIYHFNPGPPNYMDDFEIMLDFSLEAGDTLFYADGVNYFAVDSIGTIELNGEQLQAQFGKTWMDWSNGDTLTIVTEKFGPINNYLFLNITDYCMIDAPCRNFRCYKDDNFPLLQLSEEDCDYIPGYEVTLAEGKKWKYAFAECDIGGGYEATLGNDTLVDGINYKALIINDTCGQIANPGFLREDIFSGKLWFLRASDWEEILLMDMSLQVGDTFTYNPDMPEPLVTATVANVDFINGRKVIAFSYTSSICLTGESLKFIEGIGPFTALVKRSFLDGTEWPFYYGAELICAETDTGVVYETPELSWMNCSISCYSTDVSETKHSILRMTLSPNPVSNHLQITFPQPTRNASLRLFSATSEILLERTLPAGIIQEKINMDAFPAGLYFVQLFENERIAASGKFIRI